MPPGKEGKIELAVEHTEGYSGEIAKSAYVTTNDPRQPGFNLVLRARFKGAPPTPASPKPEPPLNPSVVFNVEPGDRWITSALVGTSAANYFYLYNRLSTPFHVKNVIEPGPNFTTNLQTIQDGKRYELRVASNPALKPGRYEQILKVATDSPAQPEVSISLELTVIPKVFASPQAINMPTLPAGADLSAINWPSIYVRMLRDHGLKIKRYTSSLEFIKLDLQTETEGQVYRIAIGLDRSKIKPGEFKGRITIETNDLDVPVIEIPVQASFK